MKKLLLLVLLLTSTAAWGSDENGNSWGQGSMSCGKLIKWQKSESQKPVINAWVAGYIAAFNWITPNTYQVLGHSDLTSAILWLENWCNANPLKNTVAGMNALMVELYPRRHKTMEEAVH